MKKILFLAPQPFFQERGTPIAVRLAASVIGQNSARTVDLLTYHEGENISIPGVTLHRIKAPEFLQGLRPGISLKKLLCDVLFTIEAFRIVWRERRSPYALVHAVEESVFIACLLKWIFKIPFIYDMDSSIALQLTEKWWVLKPLQPILDRLEKLAVRQSIAVVPVCDALTAIAVGHGAKKTTTLYDVSLLSINNDESFEYEDLKKTCSLPEDSQIVLYIGNLERYQGIDLLLSGFAFIAHKTPKAALVIIGGAPEHIHRYQEQATMLGIAKQVFLIGPRPVSTLSHYLKQATVLASPRTTGNNTPMKIYSYIHSGVPLLATNLPTHTQVLTSEIAMLSSPTPETYGTALLELLESKELRARLAKNAYQVAEERYTFIQFEKKLNALYDSINTGEIRS